eukprot:TRINITY_DN1996_c0_g1_i1.p1 TRINITY_DN1996_c0_g1~~TRINITY_DN1996_c0_g1_i1.p1  ORF type:complete len:143 (-),score=39.07 TRINITY_DN1996_c0_g1_i1:52-480(-)
MAAKCKGCDKTVYANEKVTALDASWHPKCLKCTTCQTRLSLTTLNSFDMQPYCKAHLPTAKATTVADDVMTQHGKATQATASYTLKQNIETQKGTGEKPIQTADDQLIQHSKAAQETASYARKENVETQKGTGEKPTQDETM